MAGDLFNTDLDQLIIKMQSVKEPLNKATIQELLKEFPLLNEHIRVIACIRGEQVIYEALINSLQPTPTSLVVGTSKTLTMLNFSNAKEKPPNAEENFQSDYREVLQQVRKSGGFSINELTQNFDGVTAKRQFNALFVRATGLKQDKCIRIKFLKHHLMN